MSELSKILNEANREHWSTRTIAAKAEQSGHRLSHGSVSKYLNGIHGQPTAEILQAFADVFRIDVSTLREAAGMPALGTPFILPAEAAQLTGPEREAIKHLVRVMVESKTMTNSDVVQPRGEKLPPSPGGRGYKLVDGPNAGVSEMPRNFFSLAAHPKTDSPSMREHASGERRGEESQEYPEG